MADYDRRPRRGAGQFNNRKRRYRDDDFDDRRPQRRRYEDPPAVVLRKQVLHLAESPHRKAEDEVVTVAKQIAENYFDTDLTNAFLDLSVQLTLEQPLKIPFLAAIVLVTNAQKPEFTEEVLKKLAGALQTHIDQGCWREVKLLLRFLACLQGLFMGDGIFPFLEELFSRAADLQTESSEDALGLELTKIILFSIAYAMASSATGYEPQAEALLEKTDIIASTPHLLENLVDPFPSTELGAPPSHESLLSLMQKRMTEESKAAWQLSCLPRPWKISRSDEEEDPLATAQKYPFPAITLPQTLQIGPRQIFPEVYLSVYLGQELDTVPPASNTSALLIRDSLVDSINVMHFNRTIAGKSLIDLDCYFAPDTFVKRATPFDKIGEVAGEGKSWKPEDVVVDATFAQLLSLPTPEHKPVYYHSVLTESCKIAPAAVAPSLGRAIRYLYRNVDRMDIELVQRFLDWFSHHLSNFGFTWKWTEWIEDLELPDIDPKKAFIRDALDKEIRLSFAQRIKGTLPDPYQVLISPEKEKDSPDFKYNDPATPFADLALELSGKIKSRAGDDEIDALLSQIEEQASTAGLPKPKVAVVDVYTTCIINIGSKSLSHVLAIIERNRERLLALANDAETGCRKQIISSVLEYWRWQIGTGIVIIDKLLNYGILNPRAVIEWALVEHIERGTVLSQNWCYELISRTLSKVVGRVRQVVGKIRDARLGEEERATLKEVLDKEVASMKSLFGDIEDAVSSVAAASADGMIESSDRLREEEEALIRSWGGRWVRWVRRRGAVEESWVKEELAKPLPPVPEAEPEKMEEVKEENGVAETSGERNGGEDDAVVE